MYFLQNYRKQCFQLMISTIAVTTFSAASSQVINRPDIPDAKVQPNPENLKQEINYPFNKKRIELIAAGNIVAYSGALIGLNKIWYSKYPCSGFHFFNDNAEWLQVDKAGHTYTAYTIGRISSEMWRWAGLPQKKRIWVSSLNGVAYQSIIEVLDGFSSQYGFSPGDFTANILGSALFTSQELAWDDQRLKLKFSFHRINYGEADLSQRAGAIYGKTEIERFIKDYNAQSYWFSANLHSFFPDSKIPGWLSL